MDVSDNTIMINHSNTEENIEQNIIQNIEEDEDTNEISNINNDINYNNNNNINSLTLEYFSNIGYCKYLNKTDYEKRVSKSDKKFYRKRIINSTRNMLKDQFENETLKEIFNKYIFSLISHYKILDTTEILQKNMIETQMSDIPDILNNSDISIQNNLCINPNELLFKKETKTLTMDKFVTKKTKSNDSNVLQLPLKKNINLREPEFKIKGITKKEKKENIDNV